MLKLFRDKWSWRHEEWSLILLETLEASLKTWRSHRVDFHKDMFGDIKVSLWRFFIKIYHRDFNRDMKKHCCLLFEKLKR
jgi:DNA-binding transcriptional regulator PaaX